MPISEKGLSHLSDLEHFIFKHVLQKNRIHDWENCELTEPFMRQTRENPQPKKPEESLKYLFKRVNRFLLRVFKRSTFEKVQGQMRPEISNLTKGRNELEYAFYGFYFEFIAAGAQLPIERFFIPKSRHAAMTIFPSQVPKTVSRLFVNLVQLSPEYVTDLNAYLDLYYLEEVKNVIADKVDRQLIKWEQRLITEGEDSFREYFQEVYRTCPKVKKIWTLYQATHAIKQLKRALFNQKVTKD